MDGKISVLMGIYNCADTLPQAIQSIQSQTYTNWELILCDDGSTDDTYAVAKAFSDQDSRIVLLRRSLSGKESACKCKRHRRAWFNSQVRKIPRGGNSNPF